MTNAKSTKRALFASVISMLLCMAMLIGTTFAWFTDSVTTGKNTIVAGNLDVELYSRDANGDYIAVGANDSLFNDSTLWEPGHTEVVYLRVSNLGTLALKYKLAVTVESETSGTNVAGEEFNLSDYLVFGQATGTTETIYADRAAARTAAGSAKGLGDYSDEQELYPANTEGKASEEYVALVVYMPGTVGNEANYKTGTTAPSIKLGITLEASQIPYEEDTFGKDYDEAAEYALGSSARVDALVEAGYVKAENPADLNTAITNGEKIVLTKDVTLTKTLVVKGEEEGTEVTIDLNGHTLKPYTTGTDALEVDSATVTVKNGTIEAADNRKTGNSALFAYGSAYVTVENCVLKTNSNQSFVVVTNGSESVDTTIVIKNSTISAPNVTGKKGFAAYIPAGNVTFENCDVTGHIFISGGNITLDGGTYTATGFNNQSKIWDKQDTIDYVSGSTSGSAINMGDSILIADRRSGYTLSGLTIRNITFNTEIPNVGTAYAIKYVDMNQNGAENPADYVIGNNKFNQQIDGADPVMFIDLDGNDLEP